MERMLLIKYLRFLFESADALVRKAHIEDFEIAGLHRELHDFKSRAQLGADSNSKAIDAIRALELKVSESDLRAGKLEPLKFLLGVLFLRDFARQALEERRQAKAKQQIEDFKSDIRDVLFLVEHKTA